MQCRIERVAKLKSTEQAYSFVTDFYAKAEMKKGKRAASVKGKGKEKEVVELEPIVLDDEDEGDNHSPAGASIWSLLLLWRERRLMTQL